MSKSINFVGQIFHNNGKIKSWDYIKSEYNLERKLKYRRTQLTDALPKLWKDRISNYRESSIDLCIFGHHIMIKEQLMLLKQVWTEWTISNINFWKVQKNNFTVVLWRIFQHCSNLNWKSKYLCHVWLPLIQN